MHRQPKNENAEIDLASVELGIFRFDGNAW
jgi:hypothetical protein